jgi:hypothetical protein
MNDFLSALTARNLGCTEILRPRLPSLFEPPRSSAAPSAGIPHGPSALEEVMPERRPPAVVEVTRLLESQPAPDQMQRIVGPAESDPSGRPAERIRSASMNQAVSAPAETRVQLPPGEAVAVPGAGTRELRPIALPPTLRGLEVDAMRRPDAPEGRPAVARHDANAGEISPGATERAPRGIGREQPAPASEVRRAHVVRSEVVSIRSVAKSAPAATVVEPRVAPDAEPANGARSGPRTTPEPTIHVTIGRVEVRATPPAAPPATRAHQVAKAMSLEEYLRRRSEGRRG